MEQSHPQNPQKKKLPKLTKKQKGFVEDFVVTGNGTQSVLKNYDTKSPKVASVMAVENLAKPSVVTAIEIGQETLRSALIAKGITPTKIAEKIEVLLEASEPIYKNNNATGEIEHVGDKTDFTAVDKGLKHATAIYGVGDPEAPKSPTGNTYNFLFSAETQKEVKEIEARIKERLINPKQE